MTAPVFLPPNLREEPFAGVRLLKEKDYANGVVTVENGLNPQELRSVDLPAAIQATTVRDIHNRSDLTRTVATHGFSGQREFREQGKSQEFLNRRNPPLTIEQVRELLNKNK